MYANHHRIAFSTENYCLNSHRILNPRLTNDKTSTFTDVIYLDLVDLDKNPSNCIILEKQLTAAGGDGNSGGHKSTYYDCPHHIVSEVARIIKEEIRCVRAVLNIWTKS